MPPWGTIPAGPAGPAPVFPASCGRCSPEAPIRGSRTATGCRRCSCSFARGSARGATAAMLIEAGADPNRKYPNGEAPLHAAIRTGGTRGKAAVAEELLAGGADPCIRDAQGFIPYSIATEGGPIHRALDRARGHDLACQGQGEAISLDSDQQRRIQLALASAGYDPGPADGKFGPRTRRAIEGWQQANGYAPTGELTNTQSETLLTDPSPRSASREEIREAQSLLAALGYAPGPADGRWGSRSMRAYEAFLRDASMLPAVTLNPDTLQALRDKVKPAARGCRYRYGDGRGIFIISRCFGGTGSAVRGRWRRHRLLEGNRRESRLPPLGRFIQAEQNARIVVRLLRRRRCQRQKGRLSPAGRTETPFTKL